MKTKLKRSYYRKDFQVFISIIVVLAMIFSFIPLFITVLNALKSNYEINANIFAFPNIDAFWEDIKFNFSTAWGAIETSFISTILLSIVGGVVNCLLGSILAYIFTYKDFYGKNGIFLAFISVMMLPSIMGMPILVPFVKNTLGLGGTYIGYLLPNFAGGQVAALFLLRTFFGQQPKAVYESARIDGASDVAIYLRITVPMAFPIILYYFVGAFASYYNDYLWASLILGEKMTMMPKMLAQQETFVALSQNGAMYAMYIISAIPIVCTSIISMKYFKDGEFAAGMKL